MTLFVERRRPALTPDLMVRVVLAFAMIAALLIVTNLSAIIGYRFPDPDDTLRLIEVRDLIAGQAWFDLAQHRIDAPNGGVEMHWSRLVDLPLAAVILLLRSFIGQGAAETVALIVVPLATFGIALFFAGRIAWRLVGDEATGFACLAMALSVPLIQQLRPMRIDHHGWQIVCVLAAMNGLMARSPRYGGWFAGIALAAGLSISIEGLPLAGAICGVTAIRWLRDRSERIWLTATLQGLAVGSLGFYAATRGFGGLAQFCDAISPAHLAAFGVAAVTATGLARFEPLPRFAEVAGLALVGGLSVLTLLIFAPQCASGAFGSIDPTVAKFWYDGVGEGLPIWRQDLGLALQIAVPPLVGLFATLKLAGKSGGWLRRWWQDYAMILFAALLVALFVARAGAVAGALAAVPLGWQIREWLRSARNMRRPGRRALALAGIALALAPAMPLTLLTLAKPAQASTTGSAPVRRVSNCQIPEASATLRTLPHGEIFAPLDIGPQLMFETGHSVVATGHHRGQTAMRTVIDTFTGTPDAALATMARRGTRYLMLCPDLVEPSRYAAAAPDGFMSDLLNGRAPTWLKPVAIPGDGSLLVWQVRHQR